MLYGDIGVAVSTAVCGTASRGANPLCLPNQMSEVRGQRSEVRGQTSKDKHLILGIRHLMSDV